MTEAFLSVGQFHKVKQMLQKFMNAKKATNDKDTLLAVQGIIEDDLKKEMQAISSIEAILNELFHVNDAATAELFLTQLKTFVIPFPTPSSADLKKLFKKEKKLKLPEITSYDFNETMYFSWEDHGSNKQYIVTHNGVDFQSMSGVVDNKQIKGICTFCRKHTNTRLFTTNKKGSGDMYVKNSQYICVDSIQCNEQLTKIDVIEQWIKDMKAK